MKRALLLGGACVWLCAQQARAASYDSSTNPIWARYFATETARLEARCLTDVRTREDWQRFAPEYRRQLREMLGLEPWPERTPLKSVVTGTVEHPEFTVEKLHFQSLPGLYVTGNLFLPRNVTNRVPAVLYVSGHGPSKKNGVSFGNKVSYQHHGAWFARQGYVCLIIDTIQMGEIEGLHHGTYREGMWWWNSRGYTPAGVEAWNSIRAIDYLQTRPEVDGERIGMTGRSGGGAYSWWTAAIDERVKAVAPIAGITDLHNHVVDGTVEGHCDCMFMVNTYRWDYAQVAALVAPRPLLIGNTDRDTIFPLDGVQRVHRQVAGVYKLLGAETNLALVITEGPHHDTQDLQVPVLRWFNRFLKSTDPLITIAAEKFFEPEQLKVFAALPGDQINTRIHEVFVATAPVAVLPTDRRGWETMAADWQMRLREKVFAGWPGANTKANLREISNQRSGAIRVRRLELETQPDLEMPLVILEPRRTAKREVELLVLDHTGWQTAARELEARFGVAGLASPANIPLEPDASNSAPIIPAELDHPLVLFVPRGAGLTAPEVDARGFVQFRRRFMMLGQTLDGMRVWDIRRAIQVVDSAFPSKHYPLSVRASGRMAGNVTLAALFEPGARTLSLAEPPANFHDGPDYLAILKILDLPALQAWATATGRLDERRP